jgi:predicted metal-dependent peptidase
MFNTKLTAEQRLEKAVIAIMANPKYVALSGVMMIGSRKIDDKVPTACTNGRDEKYGRAFVESLNDKELRFLVLHEVYHKLYRHLTTWRWMYDENAQAANQACDYVINIKLVDDNKDGFATMTGPLTIGCFDDKYRGWDSAMVYADLKKQGRGKPQSGEGQPGGEGFDEHDWDDAKAMTTEETETLAREIDEALRQGALAAGKMGSGGDRSFDELLQPQVDWRAALRDFITSTCAGKDYSTWKKPNRRFIGAGIYMPSGISEQVEDLVIAPDMSGSTFAPGVLPAFMAEVKAICETVRFKRVHVLYWDTAICGAETYELHELDNMINMTKPTGGGGTEVECVGDYMREHNITPQAVIVLTDGYLGGSWGTWTCPVLWAVIDNARTYAPNGTTVHITAHSM